ncbi:MAG: hypothetical protein U0R72_10630 [Nakamurella multipartita]
MRSSIGLDDIGGLENLKTWLRKRNGAWLDEAAAYGLPAPKGVLVTGVPGCGKLRRPRRWRRPGHRCRSGWTSAASSVAWSVRPSRNMRTALRTAEAIAPCVLWIDEIEKACPRPRQISDARLGPGTAQPTWSWLQEKIGGASRRRRRQPGIGCCPPWRWRGVLDEIFFIDLPTVDAERKVGLACT